MDNEQGKQISYETDRVTLREYLKKRMLKLAAERKLAASREEDAYLEGGAMELLCLYDELLNEQPQDDLLKKLK